MAGVTEETVAVRQIQGLAVLLSCLPANGKCRELFTLALDSPERPTLDRIAPPENPDSADGLKSWLEGHWGADGATAEEQKILKWQADPENMTAAVGELKAVADKLHTT
ncbi:MAG: DurN family substrate-assisted peptide maturase [Solirubrobacteraceae bacterium]